MVAIIVAPLAPPPAPATARPRQPTQHNAVNSIRRNLFNCQPGDNEIDGLLQEVNESNRQMIKERYNIDLLAVEQQHLARCNELESQTTANSNTNSEITINSLEILYARPDLRDGCSGGGIGNGSRRISCKQSPYATTPTIKATYRVRKAIPLNSNVPKLNKKHKNVKTINNNNNCSSSNNNNNNNTSAAVPSHKASSDSLDGSSSSSALTELSTTPCNKNNNKDDDDVDNSNNNKQQRQ